MTTTKIKEFKRRVMWRAVRGGAVVGLAYGLLSWVLLYSHGGERKLDIIGAFLIPFLLAAELSHRTVPVPAFMWLAVFAAFYLTLTGALIGALVGSIRNSRRGL